MTCRNTFCSSRGKVRKETSLRDFLFHLIPIGNIKHLDFQSFNIAGANFSILRKFVFCVLISTLTFATLILSTHKG